MDGIERFALNLIQERVGPLGPPWVPTDDPKIEALLQNVARELAAELDLEPRAEWDHYGSGWASFAEVWFPGDPSPSPQTETQGVSVLLSRLGPVFALSECSRASTARTASADLPSILMLDRFKGTALEPLANRLDSVLARMGWTRLRKEELAVALPSGVDAPTILSDPPYRLFDAVFHWED